MSRYNDNIVIVPCSGIGKPFGTVSREATYELCQNLRPNETQIVALSKLVLGDKDARDAVRKNDTITIDGCKQMCASKMVKQSGGNIVHELSVIDVFRLHKDLKPEGISELNESGKKLAYELAKEITEMIDQMKRTETIKGGDHV